MSKLDTRAVDTSQLPREPAPVVEHEFRVFVSQEAFDRIVSRGRAEAEHEVGGVLVGRLARDDGGAYLVVDSTIDALHAKQKQAELTFTHETWDHIHREMDEHHKGRSIVGWYHTHPGFGVFLSDRDSFIHASFFNLPHQIALVYDPKSRQHGLFCWKDGEPVRARRYWIDRSEQVFEGPAEAGGGTEPGPEPEAPAETAEAEGESMSKDRKAEARPETDFGTLGIVFLLALLIGGVGGWWFGTRSAGDALRNAQVQVERARVAGYQEAVKGLNAEMLALVREAIGGRAVTVPLDQTVADLNAGVAGLERSGRADSASLGRLREARDRLTRLRQDYANADLGLRLLQEVGRQPRLNPADVARELSRQQGALGQLYAEMAEDAAGADDLPRALRLLQTASVVDPPNAERYERRSKELEGGKTP